MKIINEIVYLLGLFMTAMCLLGKNNVLFCVLSIPGVILINSVIHEAGHVAGCIAHHLKINEVATPLFSYRNQKLQLNASLRPISYCSFQNPEKCAEVYLMGPVFSLINLILAEWLIPSSAYKMPLIIAAFITLIINAVPYRNNDMAVYLKYRKRDS